jgi:hypothetical protein
MRARTHEQRGGGRLVPRGRAAIVLLALGLLGPALLSADPPRAGGGFPRFRLELSAGNAWVDPTDLNLLAEADDRYQEFSYETYFDHLVRNGQMRSWSRTGSGERRRVTVAPLLELRLKYFLFDSLAVSAGFRYARGGGSQELVAAYFRNELSGEQYVETLTVSPYRLSAAAGQASVGLHYSRNLGRSITAEGYLAAGVARASLRYQSSWTYSWVIHGPNYTWTPYDSAGLLEMDGKGTSFCWEAGARLEMPVAGALRAFLEGGYARQVADSLSGGGREVLGSWSESWEGPWRIRNETVTAPWGTLDLRAPSNRPRESGETAPFRLDLSGLRLRLGLSLAL